MQTHITGKVLPIFYSLEFKKNLKKKKEQIKLLKAYDDLLQYIVQVLSLK